MNISIRGIIWLALLPAYISAAAQQTQQKNTSPSCEAISNIRYQLQEITAHPKKYIDDNNNDSCVLPMIDKISRLAISTHDVAYVKALGAISQVSDGYVSEYLVEMCKDQFYKNFEVFMGYCFAHNSNMKDFTIEGLSYEVRDAKDKAVCRKKISAFADKKMTTLKLKQNECAYIRDIISHIDPKMFD